MYWNILEPSTWQLSPLATTAVVIHLQWMLDRNRVQSVPFTSVYHVPGPRNFNSNCASACQKQSDAIWFCWVKLKKAPLLSTRLWQPLVVAQKYSQYLNELLLKPTVSPPSTASEYSGMIDEELLLPRNVPYVPVEDIESLTVWHQFAKVTTLCQPWLRG